jgi:hypothetical protein
MTITKIIHPSGDGVVIVQHAGYRTEVSITEWSKALADAKVIDEHTPKGR